jgi:hypothetical protein
MVTSGFQNANFRRIDLGANNNTRAALLFQTLQLLFGNHAKTFSPEQSQQSSVVTFFSLAEEKKKKELVVRKMIKTWHHLSVRSSTI